MNPSHPIFARRGTMPALPPPPPSITQMISRDDISAPQFVDPNPPFATSCLNNVTPQHTEAYTQALEILFDNLPPNEAIKIAAEMTVSFQFHNVCKYRGKTFSYKNKEDPFHQRIERFICNFVMVKAMALNQEDPEKMMAAELSRSDQADLPAAILNDLLTFQIQFPDLYTNRNYHEDVQLLQELLKRYKVEFHRIPRS